MTLAEVKALKVGDRVLYVSLAGSSRGEVTEADSARIAITWAGGKGGRWYFNRRSRAYRDQQLAALIERDPTEGQS